MSDHHIWPVFLLLILPFGALCTNLLLLVVSWNCERLRKSRGREVEEEEERLGVEQQLQQRRRCEEVKGNEGGVNFAWISSLSVCCLLHGLIVMSLAVTRGYVGLTNELSIASSQLCDWWFWIHVILSTCMTSHLLSLCYDRFLLTLTSTFPAPSYSGWVHRLRQANYLHPRLRIVTIWIIGLVLSLPELAAHQATYTLPQAVKSGSGGCAFCNVKGNVVSTVFLTLITYLLPTSLTCIAHLRSIPVQVGRRCEEGKTKRSTTKEVENSKHCESIRDRSYHERVDNSAGNPVDNPAGFPARDAVEDPEVVAGQYQGGRIQAPTGMEISPTTVEGITDAAGIGESIEHSPHSQKSHGVEGRSLVLGATTPLSLAQPPHTLNANTLQLLKELQQQAQEEECADSSTRMLTPRSFSFKRKSSTRRSAKMMAGKSPETAAIILDRHPSLRYSVKKRLPQSSFASDAHANPGAPHREPQRSPLMFYPRDQLMMRRSITDDPNRGRSTEFGGGGGGGVRLTPVERRVGGMSMEGSQEGLSGELRRALDGDRDIEMAHVEGEKALVEGNKAIQPRRATVSDIANHSLEEPFLQQEKTRNETLERPLLQQRNTISTNTSAASKNEDFQEEKKSEQESHCQLSSGAGIRTRGERAREKEVTNNEDTAHSGEHLIHHESVNEVERQESRMEGSEERLHRLLSIIILLHLILGSPFFVTLLVCASTTSCDLTSNFVFFLIEWLSYLSILLIPFILLAFQPRNRRILVEMFTIKARS